MRLFCYSWSCCCLECCQRCAFISLPNRSLMRPERQPALKGYSDIGAVCPVHVLSDTVVLCASVHVREATARQEQFCLSFPVGREVTLLSSPTPPSQTVCEPAQLPRTSRKTSSSLHSNPSPNEVLLFVSKESDALSVSPPPPP